MENTCHRCGAVLQERDAFCSHCGAPQVRVQLPEEPAGAASPVTAPPPVEYSRTIHWRRAFFAILIPAIVVAVVMQIPVISLLFPLWIALAAYWSCSLYKKRNPSALIDGGVGARLGAVTAIFAFVLECILLGIAFVLDTVSGHGSVRAAFQQQLHDAAARNADPQTVELYNKLASSPEALAMAVAVGMLIIFFAFIVFGTIGGALGGSSIARRRLR